MSFLAPRINILERVPHYLVINKPPLCYSQPPDTSPANKQLHLLGINPNDTVINQLQHSYPDLFESSSPKQVNILKPPFCSPKIIHRLDYPASGAMVLATSTQAAAHFSKNLKFGGSKGWIIQKYYAALVLGTPTSNRSKKTLIWTPDIEINKVTNDISNEPSSSSSSSSLSSSSRSSNVIKTGIISKQIEGKPAFTRFWIPPQPQPNLPYTLVLFSPLTGRKHQIRKHAAEVLNTPVLGDTKYLEEMERRKMITAASKLQNKKINNKNNNNNTTTHHNNNSNKINTDSQLQHPKLVDLAVKYPINGIALHSYMIQLQMGLKKSTIKAPFWRNTECWTPFLVNDNQYLPDYIYSSCISQNYNIPQ